MKITIKEILASSQSLGRIGELKLNTVLKFRLGRVIKQIHKVLDDVEESRKNTIEEAGGKINKSTGLYEFPSPEVEEKVNQDLKSLSEEEVEITFDKFSEESFATLEISSIDTANCMWLFTEPAEKSDAEDNLKQENAATA